MSGFVAILGTLLLADLLMWWLSARWLKHHWIRRWLRWLVHLFFGVQVFYAVLVLVFVLGGALQARRAMEWMPAVLQALVFVWHLFMLPLTLVMWAGVGVMLGGMKLAGWLRGRKMARQEAEGERGVSRRQFLAGAVAIAPPLVGIGLTGYGLRTTWQFRMNQMTLGVKGLPAGLEGLSIAHVSDLHVGRWSSREFLDEVVRQTNALQADVVLFTGDLLDISSSDLPLAIDTLQRMRSRLGTFLVEGNHDLIDDPTAFHRQIRAAGVNFLWDSQVTLEHRGTGLQILGIPWSRHDQVLGESVYAIHRWRQAGAFPILLAHHPHAFDAAAEAGFPLTLSGHTHGGLVRLTRELNAGSMMFRYISGVYQKGAAKLVVSNGTGNWFPLRINAPAEIIHLTLRQA